MALGGVLMVKGMPKEQAMAKSTGVDAEGSSPAPMGTSNAAVPVLLITEDRSALANAKPPSHAWGGTKDQGTDALRAATRPDPSSKRPSPTPPAMSPSVD